MDTQVDGPPVLETRIPAPIGRGVHRVRLADYGVRLAPKVAYQWYVAVVPDANRRSRDILASGTIEFLQPDPSLAPRLAAAHGQELVARYAQAGIWYDALETVSDLIERTPGDTSARRYRAALLTQVGLREVSE